PANSSNRRHGCKPCHQHAGSAGILRDCYPQTRTALKADTALEAVDRFVTLPLVVVDAALILSAIRRSHKDSISFWDSLIIDAALKAGAQRLWSEDLQDGRVVNGMRIENPFR